MVVYPKLKRKNIKHDGYIKVDSWSNQYDNSDQNEYLNFIQELKKEEININFITDDEIAQAELIKLMEEKNKLKNTKSDTNQTPYGTSYSNGVKIIKPKAKRIKHSIKYGSKISKLTKNNKKSK